MTCSACSSAVEKSVSKLTGVSEASVNLLANNMTVDFDDNEVNTETIINAVRGAGYDAFLYGENIKKEKTGSGIDKDIKNMKTRLIVSAVFLVPLMYIMTAHMFSLPLPSFLHGEKNMLIMAFTQFLLALPVVFVNKNYFTAGFKALLHKAPNMDTLIAIGSSASMLYGIFAIYIMSYAYGHGQVETAMKYAGELYFDSAATILTLITLGKYLEAKAKGKTSDAIKKLIDLAPKTAFVIKDGKEIEIPADDLREGDLISVKPGARIPADGTVMEGISSVDQSAITGESIPVEKTTGDKVSTATINKNGHLIIKAEKVGKDTSLAQIIELVEEANSTKAPISKLADKISGIFVPTVISIAVVTTAVWLLTGSAFEFALSMGIAVLVISCPCALGLATPVAIMVGTGRGASNGILFRSAEALETAHSVKTVVIDKTGTLTEGKPYVSDVIPAKGHSETELLKIAASLEAKSEHPLAEAILVDAAKKGIIYDDAEFFNAEPGLGIEAIVNGKQHYAGNIVFMEKRNIDVSELKDLAEKLADQGKTPLYFADSNGFIGLIAAADKIKPSSMEAVKKFRDMGIDVVMLTGDNRRTAEAIRKELSIERAVSEVLPRDKENKVRNLQKNGKVIMIGDGINDAPALARADVGMAIGAGTDIAIESADIVLVRSDLTDAATAVRLSRATMRNIKQNLFWAFFYNTIGIPLAAGVLYPIFGLRLSPIFAAAAMSLSSIFVVFNALRLRLFK